MAANYRCLADCSWAVLVPADCYEVDLEAAYGDMTDELEDPLTPGRP